MLGKGKMICNSIEAPGGVAACQYAEGAATGGRAGNRHRAVPANGDRVRRHRATHDGDEADHRRRACRLGQNVGLIKALRGAGFDGPILLGAHGLNEAPLINALQGVGGLDKLQILSRFASPDDQGKEVSALRAAAAKVRQENAVIDDDDHGLVARPRSWKRR